MFAPVSDTPKKNRPEQWVINGMPEGSVVFNNDDILPGCQK